MSYANKGPVIIPPSSEVTEGGGPAGKGIALPPGAPVTAATATALVANANTSTYSTATPGLSTSTAAPTIMRPSMNLNVGPFKNNPAAKAALGLITTQLTTPNATVARFQELGRLVGQNPTQVTPVITAIIEGQKLDNGELVITAPGFQDASGGTPPAPQYGDAGGAQTPAPGSGSQYGDAGGAQTPAPSSGSQYGDAGGAQTPAPSSGSQYGDAGGALTPGLGNTGGGSVAGYGITPVATTQDDQAIQNMGVLPPGGDISEMCFVVLMSATNDQDKDLELIMAETKAETNSKQALRALITQVGQDVAANAAQQCTDANGAAINPPIPPTVYPGTSGTPNFYSGDCPTPVPNPNSPGGYDTVNTTLWTPTTTDGSATGPNYNELKNIQDDLKGQLDSMNEMSEMTSMRLQMAMDRRSKFVEALSNVMKKIDSTQETVVQNLK